MKVTATTKRVLRNRREAREMARAGWEYVSEGGGKLWELHRGYRVGYQIVAAQVACHGLGLWVKIQDMVPQGENSGQPKVSD